MKAWLHRNNALIAKVARLEEEITKLKRDLSEEKWRRDLHLRENRNLRMLVKKQTIEFAKIVEEK